MAALEELFDREFTRLVRSLGVAFGADDAADAVQEAFIAADRSWWRVGRYDDPVGWVRRVAVSAGTVKSTLHDARRRLRVSLAVTDD